MSLPRLPALRIALILLLSCALVVAVTWFVPASAAATVNWLFRVRGATATADDVVIVAIDDASLQSIGQWPWPRNVMAETLDRLTAAQPAAIGLDVIYAEPAVPSHDQQLAAAVQRNARVVLPAQLFETAKNETASIEWMRPDRKSVV